jgi:ABC-type multidrug transport system fused ATPase/permease subunit
MKLSSLDSESESFLQKGHKELLVGRTVIVITHRLSILRSKDRILISIKIMGYASFSMIF